ncbi:hypothetical protein [Demequina sp.]|uniref:hypothetical protein n=1 Tax=Demequina sp. TaxID=2050685 RepID=UPI003D1125B8
MNRTSRSAVALLVLGIAFAMSPPASAAPPVGCINSAYKPIRSGMTTITYGKSKQTCPTGYSLVAAYQESRQQEQFVTWLWRGSWEGQPSNLNTNTVTQEYDCEGHGVDNWRTKGQGYDNWDRWTYSTSGSVGTSC